MGNLPPWKPLNSPLTPKATPAPKGNAGSRKNYAAPKAARPDPLSNSPIPLLNPPKKQAPKPLDTGFTNVKIKAPANLPKPTPTNDTGFAGKKPSQLPSTSGKTTVPARTVTPHPAPVPKAQPAAPVAPKQPARKPAAVKTVAAPPQVSPQDQATQAVTAALAPLYAAQGTQATGQNTAIANLTRSIIAQLMPGAAQVGGQYDQAIGQQTNLSNSAADALRAANPNTQDQALLSAINAPQAQRDQLANQNSAAFNGAAAVGQYVGGVLPMSSLQSEKLAAMGLAHQMPAIEGLRGQQALSAALTNQSAERAKIDAMRPDLIQKYTAANTAAQQKQDYLDMARQRLGLQAQGQSFNQKLAVTKTNMSIDKYNASQTAKANKIDVTVSKSIPGGIARNSNGDPIVRGGKVITINANGTTTPKVPTASQISGFVDKWKNGTAGSIQQQQFKPGPDGTPDKTQPILDANGAPVYKSVPFAKVPQLSYGQAYRRLRAMRVSDQQARGYLNTAYARGEQGRAWVTNREQSALSKAGLAPRARVMTKADGTKIGVLTGAQYHALTSAGLQVPATPTSDGVWVIQQVN